MIEKLLRKIIYELKIRGVSFSDASGIIAFLEDDPDQLLEMHDFLFDNPEAKTQEILEELDRITDKYMKTNNVKRCI